MSETEVTDLVEVLEDAGFSVDPNPHAEGTCARCGMDSEDLNMGGCFPCGMLEDPGYFDDAWIWMAIVDLAGRGRSVEEWHLGRKEWGRLVPTDHHIARIIRLREERAQDFISRITGALRVEE